MYRVSYDLHIHSCLSPCGDEDMTPANIAAMAALKELQVIALTDHNSCGNCPAAAAEAERNGLVFLPGMELTTQEEVHVLCLFSELSQAMAFSAYVYGRLLPMENRPEIFGRQLVYNEQDELAGEERRMLAGSTDIPFLDAQGLAEDYGGLMIPAHIDKNANSLLHNLGFVPEGSRFSCVETARPERWEELAKSHRFLRGCRRICNSDAHYLGDIHEAEYFLEVRERSARGVLEALRGKNSGGALGKNS